MTSPRYIVRPKAFYTTPYNLKQILGAKRTLAFPFTSWRRPSLTKDFFLTYPPEQALEECVELRQQSGDLEDADLLGLVPRHAQLDPTTEQTTRFEHGENVPQRLGHYRVARQFSTADKPSQRLSLHSDYGFPIPPTATTHANAQRLADDRQRGDYPSSKFIVRPTRHTQGNGWRLTTDPTDFTEGQEYIQCVYPKNHEYRVIAVRGVPIITLLKRIPPDLPRSQPWNYSNGSSFVTVQDRSLDRLRHTDFYDRLSASRLFAALDLAGIDIMYRRPGEYVITEVNLCPAITILDNLQKVATHARTLF